MTKLLWNYNRAWTLLDESGGDIAVENAVEHALAQAEKAPKRRERMLLRSVMRDVVQFQHASGAETCFVLSTTAPWVRMIAYTVTHSVEGVDRADAFVEDARAARPSMLGEADVTEHDLPTARATRVEMRERKDGKRGNSVMTVVRWIMPIVDGGNELTVVVSCFVPDENDVPLARPMLDELLRGMSVAW